MTLHDSLPSLPAQVLESLPEEHWDTECANKEFLETLAQLEIRTAERFRDRLKSRPLSDETLALRLEIHEFISRQILPRLRSDDEAAKDPAFFRDLLGYRAKLVEYSEKI